MLAVTAFAGLMTASPVRANDWSNAIDVCQAALPSSEADLRKRPLGIINEGTATHFVSCSLRAPLGQLDGGGVDVSQIILLLTNRASAAQPVACTLVDGVAAPFPSFPAIYLPKTVDIQPNGFAVINWFDFETTAGRYRLPNLSCALPPGAEINIVQMNTVAAEA
ncbi:MAG TPA: hypothetical protein VLK29_03410 [Luteimonas sp.]|nr:hypothetical protein [Luteimonas sp.]